MLDSISTDSTNALILSKCIYNHLTAKRSLIKAKKLGYSLLALLKLQVTGANSERTAICTTTPTSAENWQSERKLGMARRVRSQSRSVYKA